jgi:2-keto-4-pentenoate hydratase/2-oxohepta-3-ene-1,7-dioic acid hydratase in catechol pathway
MYFATFIVNGQEKIGVLNYNGNAVIPIEQIVGEKSCGSMLDFIKGFSSDVLSKLEKASKDMEGIDLNTVTLEAPIPEPLRGIICLGKNYREHVKEVARAIDQRADIPVDPIYFSKLVDRAVGQDGIVKYPQGISEELDYEAELAVIIGKEGRDIPADKVEEYIFGYTILNDISIRDIQRRHIQWLRGKSFDGTCPIGPYIAYKSEIPFPVQLDVKSYVNGELRQNSNTKEFIFDISYVISEFSRGITLKSGDIIATGTPAGVGMGFIPTRFLRPGDVVECCIEKIGTLRNRVL